MRTTRCRWYALAVLVAAGAFAAGGWLLGGNAQDREELSDTGRQLQRVVETIRTHYVDSVSDSALYRAASRELIASLDDPYAALLVDGGYEAFNAKLRGTRVGVGLDIDHQDERVTVAEPVPDSPASRAGLSPGDEILTVNGQPTEGWGEREALAALGNAEAESVTIVVRRAGGGESIVRQLDRDTVHIPAAQDARLYRGGVGYIALRAITAGAAAELREAIERLRARGMRSLVLDLRGNPGGLIHQGVEVAELFLDRGDTVAVVQGRHPRSTRTYVATGTQPWPALRVALLVDGNTASSAELIAGALQDHDRAVLVGTRTFGKGVVQTVFGLRPDVGVKFTTARWYTPAGRTVHPLPDADGGDEPRGLAPDVKVPATHRQLPVALRLLRSE